MRENAHLAPPTSCVATSTPRVPRLVFGVGETSPAAPPDSNAVPFRVQDYTACAAQLEVTARQLTELLVTLDRTIGSTNLTQLTERVSPVVQQAEAGGKEIVDYAFWKGIIFVAFVLVAALVYRTLVTRLTASNSKSGPV